MLTADAALRLVQDSFDSLHRSGTVDEPVQVTSDLVLLGQGAKLDSIGFVTFITELEDRLQLELDRECYLVLNDIGEFNVNSPTLTAGTLVRFMERMAGAEAQQ